MKLVKIHRILTFKQSNWLKKYVDFNTLKRKESTNQADKHYFKLMINSIYGKSCESVRKRMNIKLINKRKTYSRCVNKPNFI